MIYSPSRYRCTSITAIAPSPTADATRLAESERASPATNTPGTLVSRWNGGAVRRPFLAAVGQIGSGEHETVTVAGERAVQPIGARERRR